MNKRNHNCYDLLYEASLITTDPVMPAKANQRRSLAGIQKKSGFPRIPGSTGIFDKYGAGSVKPGMTTYIELASSRIAGRSRLRPELLILSLSFILFAGCMVGPNYQRPEVHVPANWAGSTRDWRISAMAPEKTLPGE